MSSSARSTSLTGLTQGTTYEYRITAIGDGTTYADSATTSSSTFKTLIKCATPTVTLTRSTSSFTASWSAVTGATSYTIRYKLSTASSWTTTTTTSTSKTISGTSGATYYVQVMATTTNASYTDSDYSTQQSVVIQTKLATPGSPSITGTTTSSITFGWSAVTNASSYTVYYKLSSASTWSSTTTTSTSWTKSSLSEGVTYNFKVKANGSGNYVDSDETTSVSGTSKTTLATPTGLAVARTINSLTASWSRVSNNAGYTLQYKLSSASTWTSVTLATNVENYTLSGLSQGKTYQFQVKALGSGNYVDSAYCTAVSATTKIKLATPTGLTASNVLSTTATLSWTAVTNATSYWLDIVDSNGSPAAGGAYSGISVTGTTINLTDLDETEQYTVSLIATSSSSDYVDSDAATLDFTTDEKLATPSAPTLTKGTTWITATWGTISAADSYNVRYKTGTGSWETVNVPSGTTYTLSPIAEGTTYQFQVQAVTENEAYESSDWSASSTATTLITLDTPTGLTATDVTINSATIGWTGDDRATQFKIEYRASGASTWTTKTVDA